MSIENIKNVQNLNENIDWIPEDLIEYGTSLSTDQEYEAYRLMMLTRLHTLNLPEEEYESFIRMNKE